MNLDPHFFRDLIQEASARRTANALRESMLRRAAELRADGYTVLIVHDEMVACYRSPTALPIIEKS